MNRKYACIHGHFYQPPRENPWLEEVELQDSARPHHDWNERITYECYAPNTASRLLDGEGRVIDIISNYSLMSFNFGPTLLSWLERRHPATYAAILQADAMSRGNFSGHGSAMAQCYNHMIMPLAAPRDKRTQVLWGIEDFRHRFGRSPEGMWLPEAAVDQETLGIMADNGIKFVVLAPGQARRVRKLDTEEWFDVAGGKVDPRRPYLCRLPENRSIALFFYNGPLSREIAFNGMLNDGDLFFRRMSEVFDADPGETQLSHIATDGETYGHHHRYGDMALAYCLSSLRASPDIKLTVYGELLAECPPDWEAEVWENSSWSCVHGVERWRSDCGCNSGSKPDWNQKWRAPLRAAFDWLRDNLAQIYDRRAAGLMRDPWAARDSYISLLLDRSPEKRAAFLKEHQARELSAEETLTVMRLLEMQRNAMLMYTSCGWFFDEISGIETVQVISYAARAVQLARQASGVDLEGAFLDLLDRAPSNLPDPATGKGIYERYVKPAMLDLLRVGVHYGASSVFEKEPGDGAIYCYDMKKRSLEVLESGPQRLAVGMVDISSRITGETNSVSFVMLYLGGYNLLGAAREFMGEEAFSGMSGAMRRAFTSGDLAEMTRRIAADFPEGSYSLWHLFRDEQRKVIDMIFASAREEMLASFRQIYGHHSSIFDITARLRTPLPEPFPTVAQAVLNDDVSRALAAVPADTASLARASQLIRRFGLTVDRPALELSVSASLNALADSFAARPDDCPALSSLAALLDAVAPLGLELNLWRAQNIFFRTGRPMASAKRSWASSGNAEAARWLELFAGAAERLNVRLSY